MISRCLDDLRIFTLSGNGFSNLTTNGLLNLTRLDSLTEIAFDQNPLVSNTVIVGFVDGAPGLRSISLANAGSDTVITEDGLMSIAKLKDIRDLNLSCLAAVTNRFLLAIVNCPQLRNLLLRSCTFLGDLGILALAACTKIELVDVSGCLLVSNDSVQKLIRSFPVDSESDCCEAITLIIGGTACDQSRLRPRGSRIVLDTSNYSTLGGYTVPSMDTAMGEKGSDEDISDDEFESLNAQRSFIIDALHAQEDDSPIDDQQILEWAEREAQNLGLIKSP